MFRVNPAIMFSPVAFPTSPFRTNTFLIFWIFTSQITTEVIQCYLYDETNLYLVLKLNRQNSLVLLFFFPWRVNGSAASAWLLIYNSLPSVAHIKVPFDAHTHVGKYTGWLPPARRETKCLTVNVQYFQVKTNIRSRLEGGHPAGCMWTLINSPAVNPRKICLDNNYLCPACFVLKELFWVLNMWSLFKYWYIFVILGAQFDRWGYSTLYRPLYNTG